MIRSVARRLRTLTAPAAVLLVATLTPSPATARPAAPSPSVAGTTAVTTRLAPPAGLQTPPPLAAAAPGLGAPQPACDPARLPKGNAATVASRQATKINYDGAQLAF